MGKSLLTRICGLWVGLLLTLPAFAVSFIFHPYFGFQVSAISLAEGPGFKNLSNAISENDNVNSNSKHNSSGQYASTLLIGLPIVPAVTLELDYAHYFVKRYQISSANNTLNVTLNTSSFALITKIKLPLHAVVPWFGPNFYVGVGLTRLNLATNGSASGNLVNQNFAQRHLSWQPIYSAGTDYALTTHLSFIVNLSFIPGHKKINYDPAQQKIMHVNDFSPTIVNWGLGLVYHFTL